MLVLVSVLISIHLFFVLFGSPGFDYIFCALAYYDFGFPFLFWSPVYDPCQDFVFEPACLLNKPLIFNLLLHLGPFDRLMEVGI